MEKLIITAFKKPEDSKKNEIGTYSTFINPASLNIEKTIIRNDDDKTHGKNSTSSFGSYDSEKLSFELLIDGTGIADRSKYVQEEIQELEALIYDYQNESHEANFIRIGWGSHFIFRGYLTTFQINYTLFDSNGDALRAKLSLAFEGFIPPATFEKNPGQSSPDMSHIKFVTESDTLANYCDDIYGDPKYLIQAAKFNGLINFRKLKPGKRLEFPPLINIDYV